MSDGHAACHFGLLVAWKTALAYSNGTSSWKTQVNVSHCHAAYRQLLKLRNFLADHLPVAYIKAYTVWLHMVNKLHKVTLS